MAAPHRSDDLLLENRTDPPFIGKPLFFTHPEQYHWKRTYLFVIQSAKHPLLVVVWRPEECAVNIYFCQVKVPVVFNIWYRVKTILSRIVR